YVSGSGTDTVTAGATTGALSDGIVGWGRWSSGTYVDSGSSGSTYALSNVHYVVGLPTPSADPVWSSGVTASYALLGYTLPTRSTDGLTGTGAVTGSLTVNFATSVVGLSLGVPFNGTNHSFTAGSGSVVNSSTAGFSGSLMGGSGGSFSGFLAGANASRAGLVYGFDDGVGTVSGAATFKRQ
ncbi:MAG: hypothetical protein Q8O34_15990, partial [Rhodocyclaceae bacterium]|nr:hypothetical protein [Rhodocyclaceae bacterium]